MEKDILIKLAKKYPNDQDFGYYVRMMLQEKSCKCGNNCKCKKDDKDTNSKS